MSRRSYDHMPWIIIDFKRDKLLKQIEGAKEINIGYVPDERGLYIVRPHLTELKLLEQYLWNIWETEDIGLFIDEGYMLKRSQALEAIYIQGRSKTIPVITLSQRPSWISRFTFSEAEYHQVFRLTDDRDIDTVSNFVKAPLEKSLAKYHSHWYDVSQELSAVFSPVPNMKQILATFRDRIPRSKFFI